jgi:trehalose/maltose transport system permease protein
MAITVSIPKKIPRTDRKGGMRRQVRLAMLLLLPTFIVLGLVAFYPLARTFGASMTDEVFARPDLKAQFIGLNNYQKLLSVQIIELPTDKRPVQVIPSTYYLLSRFQFGGKTYVIAATDPEFINAALNTIIFTLLSVSTEIVLGMGLAMLVNMQFAGRGLMRTVMLMPWVIPTVVSAQLWKWMFFDNRAGVINDFLLRLGLITESLAWRAEPRLQLISVVLVDVWKTTPYVALLLLAGLQRIPDDLYEAATVDGASPWEQFIEITLPMLRPIILLALIFRTLDALRVFDTFAILLGQAVPSLATYNQHKLLGANAYGYASAVGVVIFLLTFLFTVIYMSIFRMDEAQ